MKLRPDTIEQHFRSGNNSRIAYWVSGDEVLLRNESTDAVRSGLQKLAFTEREKFIIDTQFDWTPLLSSLQSPSLFAEKKRLELDLSFTNLNKTVTDGIKAVLDTLDAHPRCREDNRLLIYSNKFEAKHIQSAWYKKFCAIGAHIPVWPINRQQLPQWLSYRMQSAGLKASPEVVKALADQVEGNLLAAQQEIEKLALLHGGDTLSLQHVQESGSDLAQYSIFDLADAILSGNTTQALRCLDRLQESAVEPTLILWAVTRDIRLLIEGKSLNANTGTLSQWMKSKRLLPNRQMLVKQALQRISFPLLKEALALCQETDASIKGLGALSPWHCLAVTAQALCSGQLDHLHHLAPATNHEMLL